MTVYHVYIVTNSAHSVLYVGVTNDLKRRLHEHKSEIAEGFTKRYHIHKLVYYEAFKTPEAAIAREKQLKGWKRDKKDALIKSLNPNWDDLMERLTQL